MTDAGHDENVAEDCDTCREDVYAPCSASKRPCGHHCNHSWSHDSCCWCGEGADEEGNWPSPLPTLEEVRRFGLRGGVVVGPENHD